MPRENAGERRRILGVGDVAVAREVVIVQPRHPKTQGGGAQYRPPSGVFGFGERAAACVGRGQSFPVRRPETTAVVQAPVVVHHRQVEQQAVAAGVVEVDQAGNLVVLEQDVVAKQVGVDHAARQVRVILRVLEGQFLIQHRQGVGVQLRRQVPAGGPDPVQAAGVGVLARKGGGGVVQVGEHRAQGGALFHRGRFLAGAVEPVDQGRGFAGQGRQEAAVTPRHRVRAGHAAGGEVVHQFQEEGQLRRAQALENGQHPVTAAGVDEIVGVGDALGNAAIVAQSADMVVGEEGFELGGFDTGVNRHGQALCNRFRNTRISLAAWLSPRFSATAMPVSKALAAAVGSPLAARALPYSFQAAE
jgi:hypothetical protein